MRNHWVFSSLSDSGLEGYFVSTIGDLADFAWETGFEAGVAYAFGHISEGKFTLKELEKFVNWIELKCPWKDYSEWFEIVVGSHHTLTKERYEECKRQYEESAKKWPHMADIFKEKSRELDDKWKRIVEAGFEKP